MRSSGGALGDNSLSLLSLFPPSSLNLADCRQSGGGPNGRRWASEMRQGARQAGAVPGHRGPARVVWSWAAPSRRLLRVDPRARLALPRRTPKAALGLGMPATHRGGVGTSPGNQNQAPGAAGRRQRRPVRADAQWPDMVSSAPGDGPAPQPACPCERARAIPVRATCQFKNREGERPGVAG